jgi:osmotically-inducible protein OsmY
VIPPFVIPLLAGALALGISCSNTVEGLKKDAKENRVEEKTEKAAEKVAEAVKEAGRELDAKTQGLQVKAALMADKNVDAGHIDVDANEDTRTITLKGSVPTSAQKRAAEAIAHDKAEGYRVKNELAVVATR